MTASADIPAGDGERRHDPMCPYERPCTGLLCVGYGSLPHAHNYCECDLIARVREDERGKAEHDGYVRGYAHGSGRSVIDAMAVTRAAALRDAIAAVESREDGEYFPWPQVEIAIAAIQDLQP